MVKNNCNRADQLAYHALTRAIEADKLRIYMDYGKINRPSSPVYNPWETLLPILVPILLGLLLIIGVGVIFGLLFIIAMILVYSTVVKKKLYQRIIHRIKQHILAGYEPCCELWKTGGVVLVNADNKKSGCVSPEGDWKEFVVINFADYMVESKNDSNPENVDEKNKSGN